MKNKNFFKIIRIFLIVFFIFIIVSPKLGGNSLTILEAIEFVIIFLLSILGISKEVVKHGFSLKIMHWIFVMFFFVLAPIIQISFNFKPWGIIQHHNEIEYTCLMIIIWCVFYYLGSNLFKIKRKHISNEKNEKMSENKKKVIVVPNSILFILTVLSIISTIIIIRNVGFASLFSRSTSALTFDGTYSQMKSLITGGFTKAIIVFSASISIVNYYKNKKGILFLIINLLSLLLTCFPTGMARNIAGIIYMGVFVIFNYHHFSKISNNIRYILLFIVAFMVLFPAINAFRNQSFEKVNFVEVLNGTVDNITGNYLSEDYDAFSMIGNVRKYTSQYGIAYGKQLLGNILFFIPRNIWNNKPVGSGSLVFSAYSYSFTNVSCPLIAESYLNFGFVGIIIIAFIIGLICQKIDDLYWDSIYDIDNHLNYLSLIYPFALPAFFFMLRGDFLSTYSTMFLYLSVFFVLSRLLKYKVVIK